MKTYLFSLITLLSFYAVSGQSLKEKQFVIIPCKSGVLMIDGISVGAVESEDASRQTLTFGEHYLQLKTATEKINLSVTVDENTKNIIKIGCEVTAEAQGVRLINKKLSLIGLLSGDMEDNIIGLDKDDEIVINCTIINKKGTATIFITEANKSNEIYRKEVFKSLENEKIRINSRGIYKISLYTDALFGKDAKLTIDRIPSKNSSSNFNTNPKKVYDTTFTEVLKTTTRVYSAGNLDHTNKTLVSINLPANTSYWTYWIGVSQEAQDNMKNFIKDLSPVSTTFSANPLVLFGMKIIPSLPMMNSTATVNYRFMDSQNGRAFISKQPYSYFKFKHADNISTDYALIKTKSSDLVLAMQNENSFTGHNVEIRVVAFIIKSKLTLEE